MLNIEICRRCIDTHTTGGLGFTWDHYREWECGKHVKCPIKFSKADMRMGLFDGMAEVMYKPPSWCPYALEHEVSVE
jgi:hypothetical protein